MKSPNGSEAELFSTSRAWGEVACGHESTPDTHDDGVKDQGLSERSPVKVTSEAHIPTNEAGEGVAFGHEAPSPASDTGTVNPKVKQEPDDDEGASFPHRHTSTAIPNCETDESNGKAQSTGETETASPQEAPSVQRVPNNAVEPLQDPDMPDQPSTRNARSKCSTGKKRKDRQSKRDAVPKRKKGGTQMRQINRLKGYVSTEHTVNGLFRRDPETTSSNNISNDKADKSAVKAAANYFQKKCNVVGTEPGLPNNMYSVAGMKTALRDYQLVGAAFMVRLERGEKEPHGGIIADEMGLGKTLQAIACILLNEPTSNATKEGRGSTLIVVPSEQLIRQWTREFTKHIYEKTVELPHHYQGKSKLPATGLKHIPFM